MPQDFIVAKFIEKGNEWESFVWKPRKPSCLAADGSCDYAKYHVLLTGAKQGDSDAQMKIFEQHQGVWKKIIREYKDKFEKSFVDEEDLQQEAFYALMIALKQYDDTKYTKSFSDYYANVLVHHLIDIIKVQSKQVTLNCFMCSLDVRDEEGNLIYDIPDDCENDYFSNYYPQVRALLTEREFQVVITHYVDGIPLGTIAKELDLSYSYVRILNMSIKEKLKVLDK